MNGQDSRTSPDGLVPALKVVVAGTDGIAVLARPERPPETEGHPAGAGTPLPDHVLASVLSAPDVRADVVARARWLLQAPSWCRAEEVAAALVDCYVARRFP